MYLCDTAHVNIVHQGKYPSVKYPISFPKKVPAFHITIKSVLGFSHKNVTNKLILVVTILV